MLKRSSTRRFPSPLRYPGGKGKIANYFKLLFLHNDLTGYEYAEPYAGGASVALSLLYEEYTPRIYINDLNRSIFCFWDAALNNTDMLCRQIRDTSVTMDEWTHQKEIQQDSDATSEDLAFSTFFLNRTNRSGIIGGGAIGGKKQLGKWGIDARYNKQVLIRRIEKVARHRSRISLTQQDAAEFLTSTLPQFSPRTLVYLDPPYYIKGAGLYQNFYQHDDHEQIASIVKTIENPWVVSYDNTPEILSFYQEFSPEKYQLNYSAADKYKGIELMFFSPGIEHPDVDSPANIYSDIVDQERMNPSLFA